jgi:hypothetical protein
VLSTPLTGGETESQKGDTVSSEHLAPPAITLPVHLLIVSPLLRDQDLG